MAKSPSKANHPNWLKVRDGKYIVDRDKAYPAVLSLLKVKASDQDQYWVEVAYQCVKLRVQDIAAADEHEGALEIIIEGDSASKDKWALRGLDKGRGERAATKGGEAKGHYETIRSKAF